MSKKDFIGWLYENNYMISPNLLNIIPDSFDFDYFYNNKGKFLDKQDLLEQTK